jgi:hypothetical protein
MIEPLLSHSMTLRATWIALAALVLLGPRSFADSASTDGCAQTNGNWYCRQTNAITYSKFGSVGSYNRVISMDSATGTCQTAKQDFGGGLAPLDDEVSWHFRGPIKLNEFAFYTLDGKTPVKRDVPRGERALRHKHRHTKRHAHRLSNVIPPHDHPEQNNHEARGFGDWVTATINGAVVSWQNAYVGAGSPATSAPPAVTSSLPLKSSSASSTATTPSTESASSQPQNSQSSKTSKTGADNGSTWRRQSQYNAASGQAQNIAFLGHYGGQGCSGTFDYRFGNSLSYLTSDGQKCATKSTVLGPVLVPDDKEFSIFTGQPCGGGSSCGFIRPDSVAHHGFAGASKLFLLDFEMPLSNVRGGLNSDMPAAWILNANIPRTQQYGNCSCWASGCGEFDVVEVLTPGEKRAKSTYQASNALGDSNWFERPINAPLRIAVIMDGHASEVSVVVLDTTQPFDSEVTFDKVRSWLGSKGAVSKMALPAMPVRR